MLIFIKLVHWKPSPSRDEEMNFYEIHKELSCFEIYTAVITVFTASISDVFVLFYHRNLGLLRASDGG